MRSFSPLLPVLCLFASLLPAGESLKERAAALKQRFLAPCCWSESLAAHNSPASAEIAREIDKWLAGGLSEADIEKRLVERYGRRILIVPTGGAGTLLTAIPYAALLLGTALVGLLILKWRRPHPSSS